VHYGPHGPIDVQGFDCDYLVCSGYKIFAPHMGFMWGRYELLRRLPTFREDFIPDEPPGKIEAGTFVYEHVAGMDAAVTYLAQLGRILRGAGGSPDTPQTQSPGADVRYAMQAIRNYEQGLSLELGRVLRECGAQVYGISEDERVGERVPTFSFNLPGFSPREVTETLVRAGIGIRDGHMYAPRLMKRLNVPVESGVARVSLVHYNTLAEIHRFGNALAELRKRGFVA
jgi:selenocysteine lyase/cysteine desulfurase